MDRVVDLPDGAEDVLGWARDARARLRTAEFHARRLRHRIEHLADNDGFGDGDAPVLGTVSAETLEEWAATTRIWRDAWTCIVAQYAPGGSAYDLESWVGADDLATVTARLMTAEFVDMAVAVVGEMADYLDHRAAATGCPDHHTWAGDLRHWRVIYVQAAALQAGAVKPGDGTEWGDLANSAEFIEASARTASLELAAATILKSAGLAEFFQAEARSLSVAS